MFPSQSIFLRGTEILETNTCDFVQKVHYLQERNVRANLSEELTAFLMYGWEGSLLTATNKMG